MSDPVEMGALAMPAPDVQSARAFNRRTAANYDAVPYTPQPEPMLDLERAFGLAALYGCGPGAPGEAAVLDLGCGTGVQLARAAGQTRGALTGTDISSAACEQARRRLGAQAGRATLLCADLLDLTPEALGGFDLIYCVGVIYVVPPPVRGHLFDLIGACLKPGGVAVVSYYAGAMGALRAELNRMLRAAAPIDLPREARVAQARAWLAQIASQFPQGARELPAQAAQQMAAYADDPTLFHEALCEAMVALSTGGIEAALAARGLQFLSYLHPMPYAGLAASAQRATGADLFDFGYGGYRYAAFAKPPHGMDETAPLASRAMRWRSGLVRRPDGTGPYRSAGEFADPAMGAVRVSPTLTQAALDHLGAGPASRGDLHAGAARRLAEHGFSVPNDPESELDAELQKLWQAGWLTPLA